MRVRLELRDGSLVLRIPGPLADAVDLQVHSDVDLTVEDGSLVVSPAAQSGPRLEDLLALVTPDNVHAEVDPGPPVGREVW